MEKLRNPFAIRNGSIIMIEDLTMSERGLRCQCKCPACNGDFIARMGEIKVHHFAHGKDSCDEVIAYTSGLYKLISQILGHRIPFYVPALVISYSLPYNGVLDINNVDSHIKIISENYDIANKLVVSAGRHISFESVDLCFNKKNHIQALELTHMGSKMAIKVMPPDTICKTAAVSPHKDMATLVLDFSGDAEMIQTSNSKAFQNYLLSEHPKKYWIYNPKVKKAYPQLFELSERAYLEYVESQKKLEEKRKIAAQQYEEARKSAAQQLKIQLEMQDKLRKEKRAAELALDAEKQNQILALGYEQVKNRFVQQTEQIRDSFGIRWIKCELCGEIKSDAEFSSYGGLN